MLGRNVSILVLMEVLREELAATKSEYEKKAVSILVLMEVLREVPRDRRGDHRTVCFNPCFNGSVERGAHLLSCLNPKSKRFQSLF